MKTHGTESKPRVMAIGRSSRPARRPRARPEKAPAAVSSTLKIRQLLVPIDFSPSSQEALRYAIKVAEAFGASLTLLHVVEPIVPLGDGFDALSVPVGSLERRQGIAGKKLSALGQTEVEEVIPLKTLVRTGKPFHEIVTAARECGADLIIIATHGYTGLSHLLLGSTAEKVVRHAPCPVLTVRENQQRFVR